MSDSASMYVFATWVSRDGREHPALSYFRPAPEGLEPAAWPWAGLQVVRVDGDDGMEVLRHGDRVKLFAGALQLEERVGSFFAGAISYDGQVTLVHYLRPASITAFSEQAKEPLVEEGFARHRVDLVPDTPWHWYASLRTRRAHDATDQLEAVRRGLTRAVLKGARPGERRTLRQHATFEHAEDAAAYAAAMSGRMRARVDGAAVEVEGEVWLEIEALLVAVNVARSLAGRGRGTYVGWEIG